MGRPRKVKPEQAQLGEMMPTETVEPESPTLEEALKDAVKTDVTPGVTMRERLRAPLPHGAVKPHPTKTWMSSINSAFIVERLNDVFSEDGWYAKYEIIENQPTQKMVVVRAVFEAETRCGQQTLGKIYREAFGGNDNPDRGDAYKGACTDALGKVASQLGIAGEVYKGMLDEVQQPAGQADKRKGRARTDQFIHVELGRVTRFQQTQKNLAFLEVDGMPWVAREEHLCRILVAGHVAVGSRIELHGTWGKFGKAQKECIFITTIGGIYGETPTATLEQVDKTQSKVPEMTTEGLPGIFK